MTGGQGLGEQRFLRSVGLAALAFGLVSVIACAPAAAQSAGQPGAQEMKLGEDPFSVMMKWRPTTTPPDMPDFVKRTRPSEDRLDYTPLTAPEPKRPARKTPAELSATLQKMDSAGAAAKARAASAFAAQPKVRPRRPAPAPAPSED